MRSLHATIAEVINNPASVTSKRQLRNLHGIGNDDILHVTTNMFSDDSVLDSVLLSNICRPNAVLSWEDAARCAER